MSTAGRLAAGGAGGVVGPGRGRRTANTPNNTMISASPASYHADMTGPAQSVGLIPRFIRALVPHQRPQIRHQPIHVAPPAAVGQHHGLAPGQAGDGIGQVGLGGHGSAAHQHGDEGLARAQSRLDLLAHEVARIIQPPSPVRAGRQPAGADHHQHRAHFLQMGLDGLNEILAGADVVHVAEHAAGTEGRLQGVGQPAGEAGRVVAAVGEKDRAHYVGCLFRMSFVKLRLGGCGRLPPCPPGTLPRSGARECRSGFVRSGARSRRSHGMRCITTMPLSPVIALP